MFIYPKLLLNLLYVRQLMEFGLSYFIIIIIIIIIILFYFILFYFILRNKRIQNFRVFNYSLRCVQSMHQVILASEESLEGCLKMLAVYFQLLHYA